MTLTKIKTGGIQDDAVTSAKIPADAVGTSELADNSVANSNLINSAVSTDKIADDAVTQDKLADNSVGENQLKSNSVSENKITDGNITTAKIADSAVTTAKIAAGAIGGGKIGSLAVTTGKLGNNSVTTDKITDQAVTLAKLPHGTSSNDGKFLRANNGADPTFESVNTRPGRNLVINGAMNIHQRGTSSYTVNSSGTNSAYPVDRWKVANVNGSIVTSQGTDVPSGQGFAKSIKIVCSTTESSPSGETYIQYLPEARDFYHLAYGTSGAKTITVSFWVKSSLDATYGFYYYVPDAGPRVYQSTFTVNNQNTWEKKTITIAGDTGGSGFNNDTGIGAEIRIYLANGSNSSGSASQNSWGTNSSNRLPTATNFVSSTSNDFYITGFQIETGSEATDFDFQTSYDEMRQCRRYYIQDSYGGIRNAINNNSDRIPLHVLDEKMRATPSASASSFTEFSSGTSRSISAFYVGGKQGGGYAQLTSSPSNGVYVFVNFDAEF